MERVTASGVVTHDDYLQDRLVSTSSATGATVNKYLHDHAGRLTSKRTAAGAETEGFAHAIQDQLRQVRRGGAVTEKLEYDPTGAPLYRMVGSQVVYYAGPFATVTALANTGCTGYGCSQGVSGVQVAAHVILAGSRIASVRASSVLYYHRDWQGSVVATTYTGSNVGVKYRYTPYGRTRASPTRPTRRSWGTRAGSASGGPRSRGRGRGTSCSSGPGSTTRR